MIKEMTLQELSDIYHEHMIKDFPDDERKPLSVIKSRHKKKQNICVCYFEDEIMKGYSILEACAENKCLLMDYFAVFPEHRNQGVGTCFLHELKMYFSAWDGLLIESETAVTKTAEKRLAFYQKSGAFISGAKVRLYHVDYEILCLPLNRQIQQEEVKDLTIQIYNQIYPNPFQKLFLKWI